MSDDDLKVHLITFTTFCHFTILSTAQRNHVIPTVFCYWLTSLARSGNKTYRTYRNQQNSHFGPVHFFKLIHNRFWQIKMLILHLSQCSVYILYI